MTDFIMGCDESGNTGPDHCNAEQPVFVSAGLLVPAANVASVRELARASLFDLNRTRQSPLGELKAEALLGSGRGRDRAATILADATNLGALPIVVALDKHFTLGARLVDEFLDTWDNPRAGPEFCVDADAKRAVATIIGRLSMPTLLAVERALRIPTSSNRMAAVRVVVGELRSLGAHPLAYVVEGALESPDGLAIVTGGELGFPDYTTSMTPNVAGFSAMLLGGDLSARVLGATSLRLLHDETPLLRECLEHAQRLLTDAQLQSRLEQDPLSQTFGRLEIAKPAEFVDSLTEPLIQLADILAGTTVHWIKRARSGAPLDAATLRLAAIGMKAFTSAVVPGTGLVFSDEKEWLTRLGSQFDPGLQDSMREVLGVPLV